MLAVGWVARLGGMKVSVFFVVRRVGKDAAL